MYIYTIKMGSYGNPFDFQTKMIPLRSGFGLKTTPLELPQLLTFNSVEY